MPETEKDSTAAEKGSVQDATLAIFTAAGVLTRLREMFSRWITLLTSIAGLALAGISLKQFTDAPADVPVHIVQNALLGMFLLIIGVLLVIAIAGVANSQSAAPQSEAFSDSHIDPIRFFPRETAPELLAEFRNEAEYYRIAMVNQDIEAMRYSEIWLKLYAGSLWAWLDVYRARKVAEKSQIYILGLFISALIAASGGIVFADSLRQMKDGRPPGVILLGPRNGSVIFKGIDPPEMFACTGKEVADLKNGTIMLPVTIIEIRQPKAGEFKSPPSYVAKVVPPFSNSKQSISIAGNTYHCIVKIFEVTSYQMDVNVAPDLISVGAEEESQSLKDEVSKK